MAILGVLRSRKSSELWSSTPCRAPRFPAQSLKRPKESTASGLMDGNPATESNSLKHILVWKAIGDEAAVMTGERARGEDAI